MIQNKHIIRLSFIGLFLNIIANIVLYRYFMIEEVVIKQISDQNARIAEIYKHKTTQRCQIHLITSRYYYITHIANDT